MSVQIATNMLLMTNPHFQKGIDQILKSPFLKGEATANHYYRNGDKTGRKSAEQVIKLPPGTVPAIIDPDTWQEVQDQLERNSQNSTRNNRQPVENLGLLRSGLAKCGVCGRNLIAYHRENMKGKYTKDDYYCHINRGIEEALYHHSVAISIKSLDEKAWKFAIPYIKNPCMVRQMVQDLRKNTSDQDHAAGVEATLADIKRQMANLFKLARAANDPDAIDDLAGMLKTLEVQKRDAEKLLYVVEEEAEFAQKINEELDKFEEWANRVRPLLEDPSYIPTYHEKRLACQILGVLATVYPSGDNPDRVKLILKPPKIMSVISQYLGRNEPLFVTVC